MNEVTPPHRQRHSMRAYAMKLPYVVFRQKENLAFEVLWCLAVALQIAVIFAAPLFPSQDGPMHLYYVDVLRSVLTSKGAYAQYYALPHPLPPYLFQYALTLLMEIFWTPLVAEKVMLALYAIWFAIATRYLARALGPGWKIAALISVAFTLNRWVYMGFFNFNMGLATALFLIGYWSLHARPVLTPRKALVFSLLLALLATMHPVPVLFVVGYIVVYTVGARFRARAAAGIAGRTSHHALWRAFSIVLPLLLCGAIGLWIHAIAAPSTSLDIKALLSGVNKTERVQDLTRLLAILPLTGTTYRKSVALLLGVLVLFCVRITGRKRSKADGERLMLPVFLTIAGSLAIYIVAPSRMSGGSYFPQRFCIFAFILAIVALAFNEARGRVSEIFSTACAVLLILIMAVPLWSTNRALAKTIEPFLTAPPVVPGSRGAYIVEAGSWPADLCDNCNFSAEFHIAMHLFRESGIVLLNPPWNALPTTPLVTRENYPWTDAIDKISPYLMPPMARWNAAASKDHIDYFVVMKQHGGLPPLVSQFVREAGLVNIASASERFAILVAPSVRAIGSATSRLKKPLLPFYTK